MRNHDVVTAGYVSDAMDAKHTKIAKII